MAPFNTFLGILILAIPLALAMPRYTETISFQVTSLEAKWGFLLHYYCLLVFINWRWFVPSDAYCGYNGWPHNCWKYCGEAGEWCWLQPDYYCLKSSDCYPEAPCSSPCDRDKDKKLPLDAPHVRPVTTQAIFEKPVTNAVKAVAPRYDYIDSNALEAIATNTKPSVQFSDSSVSADALLTSPEARWGLLSIIVN